MSRVMQLLATGFQPSPSAEERFALFPRRERIDLEGVVVREIGEHLVGTKGVTRCSLE